ncbi:MAG: STAS domain-containing protein [Rhodospirillales bacterium]|jgi:anti-sigma B factor antagonist|nr:STAS domain-containing protein [Rhodospirillales bacterium]|tara:strand:- start:294 stop:629 length:336 start_codon:yes stop_codon:yes gene_type:complete
MKIDEFKKGDVTVVVPHGSLDIETRKLFVDVLIGLIDCNETAVLVDLSKIEFMTSTGLSAILQAADRMDEEGGKFAVCSLSEPVTKIFKLSGFPSIIKVYKSAETALPRMN